MQINLFSDIFLIGDPKKTQLDPEELFNRMNGSIWTVISEKIGSRKGADIASQGSAVAIDLNTLLTNCHVIKNSQTIHLVQGRSRMTAIVVSADEKTDRCVLKIAENALTGFAERGRDFGDLRVGERVYTIGSPGGLERTLGDGIISGLRTIESMRLIQTTAPISPGSSGGGLFDQAGNLIGITTLFFEGGQNLNFAISVSDYLRD